MLQFKSLLSKEKVKLTTGKTIVIPTLTVTVPTEMGGVKKVYKTISLNDKAIELLGYEKENILPTTKICIDFDEDGDGYLISDVNALTLGFTEKNMCKLFKSFTVNNGNIANQLIYDKQIPEDRIYSFIAKKVIDPDITVPVLKLFPVTKIKYDTLLADLETGVIDETYFQWTNPLVEVPTLVTNISTEKEEFIIPSTIEETVIESIQEEIPLIDDTVDSDEEVEDTLPF